MTPSIVSPISEDSHGSPTFANKPRKLAYVSGNRSWSEEEENYLLQTRMQKMPYKHIAAHLNKTELACRLHYHQLSHGSHRRKRTHSVSSAASSLSAGSTTQTPDLRHYRSGSEFEESPASEFQSSPPTHVHPRSRSSTTSSTGSRPHKILLPKPAPLTPRTTPDPVSGGLRIHTGGAVLQPGTVDTDRLRFIYESHRAAFWASVAAEYGSDVSPAMLEEVWRHGTFSGIGVKPPTPSSSPDNRHSSIPLLKPSPFISEPSNSAIERPFTTGLTPLTPAISSAISAPDRSSFVLPTPIPSAGIEAKTTPWASAAGFRAPAISNLLTEDRSPRRETFLERRHTDSDAAISTASSDTFR
ncbi:MAG: hypothetical protein M1821_001939 [Bathelium mastoideum]|nr:MAG: hypothetical protein M1821_001939 [Bathelium mastoideum]